MTDELEIYTSEVEMLRAELARLRDELAETRRLAELTAKERYAATEEAMRLRAAIDRYAEHDFECVNIVDPARCDGGDTVSERRLWYERLGCPNRMAGGLVLLALLSLWSAGAWGVYEWALGSGLYWETNDGPSETLRVDGHEYRLVEPVAPNPRMAGGCVMARAGAVVWVLTNLMLLCGFVPTWLQTGYWEAKDWWTRKPPPLRDFSEHKPGEYL